MIIKPSFRKSRPSTKKSAMRSLRAEPLERREVLSTVSPAEAPVLPIYDMSELAARYAPSPNGPTTLWLNFDGAPANNTTESVARFNPANRNEVIHDILFRTAEIFAPFNVEVRVRSGFGNADTTHNGNSTIFIGDHGSYTTTSWNPNTWQTAVINNTGGHTPVAHADYPSFTGRGVTHRLNSDPFNIAYVDPVWSNSVMGTGGVDGASQVAQVIAHEAGHTFGLGHVRTVGYDPAPLSGWDTSGTVTEAMSYDSSNKRFQHRPWQITAYNGSAYQPYNQPWFYAVNGPVTWQYRLRTQDSYKVLQTVLGPRPYDDRASTADPWAVDPIFRDDFLQTVYAEGTYTGTINHQGDFDVFRFASASTQDLQISAERSSWLDPVLFVYDTTSYGPKTNVPLTEFNDDSSGLNSSLSFTATAGHTYEIVVGGYRGNSTGRYRLEIAYASPTGGGWWGMSSRYNSAPLTNPPEVSVSTPSREPGSAGALPEVVTITAIDQASMRRVDRGYQSSTTERRVEEPLHSEMIDHGITHALAGWTTSLQI